MPLRRRSKRPVTCYLGDSSEISVVMPICQELQNSGYEVNYTSDFTQKSDVGLYSCHGNRFFDFSSGRWNALPSRISIMCVHDFDQTGGPHPAYFINDGWHLFDVALVPNQDFVELGDIANHLGYHLPIHGLQIIGWPPSDKLHGSQKVQFAEKANALRQELGLVGKKIVLLACSWSNQEQLRQTHEALSGSEFTIVVRYPKMVDPDPLSPWFDRLRLAVQDVKNAVEFSKTLDNVCVPSSEEDLYMLLHIADVIISNGSNVLYEGLLMNKPCISITSWKHPSGEIGAEVIEPVVASKFRVLQGTADEILKLVTNAASRENEALTALGRSGLVPESSVGVAALLARNVIEAILESK